jgi:hypothetical protein
MMDAMMSVTTVVAVGVVATRTATEQVTESASCWLMRMRTNRTTMTTPWVVLAP